MWNLCMNRLTHHWAYNLVRARASTGKTKLEQELRRDRAVDTEQAASWPAPQADASTTTAKPLIQQHLQWMDRKQGKCKGTYTWYSTSSESSPQKRSHMACVLKGSHSFTCTPIHSSAIGISHTCLCLPSYNWYSFTHDLSMIEGWVDTGGCLSSDTVYLPEVSHPSHY